MKLKSTLLAFLTILLLSLQQQNLKAEQMTIYFPVLGNCYLCKLRIEEAVNKLDGIESVEWDYATLQTTVTYDDQLCDAYMMMYAIADVGHDTEWFPAPDSAYNTLIGTCCEYERTNDYTNVEIGYLGLMDLWVFPVGLPESPRLVDMKIYPTVGNGVFNYEIMEDLQEMEQMLKIYSMKGSLVYSRNLGNQPTGKIDLSSLPDGQYVITISDSKKFLARSKLIKN